MSIQAQKAIIIEQFKQIDDINLINAIKSMLDFALNKKEDVFVMNEENNTVEVLAVISTDRNPKIWEDKTKRRTLKIC